MNRETFRFGLRPLDSSNFAYGDVGIVYKSMIVGVSCSAYEYNGDVAAYCRTITLHTLGGEIKYTYKSASRRLDQDTEIVRVRDELGFDLT